MVFTNRLLITTTIRPTNCWITNETTPTTHEPSRGTSRGIWAAEGPRAAEPPQISATMSTDRGTGFLGTALLTRSTEPSIIPATYVPYASAEAAAATTTASWTTNTDLTVSRQAGKWNHLGRKVYSGVDKGLGDV